MAMVFTMLTFKNRSNNIWKLKIATMTITRPKNRFGLAHSNGKKLVSFK